MMSKVMQSKTREIIQLDPRTKLYLLLIINIVIFGTNPSGAQLIAKGVLVAIPLVLLCAGGKWAQGIVYTVLYLAAQYVELYLYDYAGGLGGMLLRMVAMIICRMVPGLIMGYYLVSKTEISAFIAAMERTHVTQKISIPLAVVFRFLPTVGEEYRAIRDAMRMRGIGLSGNVVAMLEYRLVPLMMSVARIGDELSVAALTRGLGNTVKRTHVYEIGFGAWDIILGLVATVSAVSFFLL
ncbi:MAG: energy-coupling factor transporter transmembrane component T [Lachnospiraceae bacterium]